MGWGMFHFVHEQRRRALKNFARFLLMKNPVPGIPVRIWPCLCPVMLHSQCSLLAISTFYSLMRSELPEDFIQNNSHNGPNRYIQA
jgi:hypothetical protein